MESLSRPRTTSIDSACTVANNNPTSLHGHTLPSSPNNSSSSSSTSASSPGLGVFLHGDVVWAQTEQFLPFWPAMVITVLDSLPESLRKLVANGWTKASSGSRRKLCVYLYGKDHLDRVLPSCLRLFHADNMPAMRFGQLPGISSISGISSTFQRACSLAEADLARPVRLRGWEKDVMC